MVDEGRVAPIDQGNGLSLTRRFGLAVPGPPPAATKTDPVLGFRLLDSVDPALAAHTVLAELAVISLEEPSSSRGVVIRPPDGPLPPVETLEIMLDALTTPNALVTPVTLDQFFGQVEPLTGLEAELTPEPHDNLSTYARELSETRRLLDSYASMAGSSDAVGAVRTASHRSARPGDSAPPSGPTTSPPHATGSPISWERSRSRMHGPSP